MQDSKAQNAITDLAARQQALMEQMAAAHAGEVGEGAGIAPDHQYCVFRTGRERFCLSVLDVEEVVEWPTVTLMPLAPAFLMGIFNLRGSIVPVVDIAFTEGHRADLTPKHVVVAILKGNEKHDDIRIGIAADEVIGTYTTSDQLLVEEAPRDVPHCCGMLRHEDRLALALDLRRLIEAFPIGTI